MVVMNKTEVTPDADLHRGRQLAEYDLDYTGLDDVFKNLLDIAANIAGMPISMISLLDDYTQWAISSYGMHIEHIPREDSVCHYTVSQNIDFEVPNLSGDERFRYLGGIATEPGLRYYFGTPIRTGDGYPLGALCVLDLNERNLAPDKMQALHLIAGEVANRLEMLKKINKLNREIKQLGQTHKKIAHDIRGPVGAIVGLADIICSQGNDNAMDEVLEYMGIIRNSGSSVLDLAREIMTNGTPNSKVDQMNQQLLGDKIKRLYGLQARNKNVGFSVVSAPENNEILFERELLLQILGNIIGNAIRFTPAGGTVTVKIAFEPAHTPHTLALAVEDTGVGIETEKIRAIMSGVGQSSNDTQGEKGYGFGLGVVREMIAGKSGILEILSEVGKGTSFVVKLPL